MGVGSAYLPRSPLPHQAAAAAWRTEAALFPVSSRCLLVAGFVNSLAVFFRRSCDVMRGEFVAGRRGDGTSVCHLCGFAHPISEPLAHSKICCKKISTATTEEGAGELGDRVLLLGTLPYVASKI